jgi:hypothetical protein
VSDLNKRSDKITIYKKTTQSWNSGESLWQYTSNPR